MAPSEQTLRPEQQDRDGQRVDEDGAALRDVFLQHEVEHADQNRRIKHAGDAALTGFIRLLVRRGAAAK